MPNTDPKEIQRAVNEYTVKPWGLYMARPTPGRAQFHYLESWLLPALGLRASVFHSIPATNAIRIFTSTSADNREGQDIWHAEDHYLDLVVRTGKSADEDVDELLTAVKHGLLTPEVGEEAVRSALDTVQGASTTATTSTVGWLRTVSTSSWEACVTASSCGYART